MYMYSLLLIVRGVGRRMRRRRSRLGWPRMLRRLHAVAAHVAPPQPAASAEWLPIDTAAPAIVMAQRDLQPGRTPLERLATGEVPAIILRGAVPALQCKRIVGRMLEAGLFPPAWHGLLDLADGIVPAPPVESVVGCQLAAGGNVAIYLHLHCCTSTLMAARHTFPPHSTGDERHQFPVLYDRLYNRAGLCMCRHTAWRLDYPMNDLGGWMGSKDQYFEWVADHHSDERSGAAKYVDAAICAHISLTCNDGGPVCLGRK